MSDKYIDKMDKIETGLKLYNSTMGTQIDNLKEEQRQALVGLMHGDVLCVLPTGFGKSLIFGLLPYVCTGSIVVLISPLNAIIAEQHSRLGSCSFVVDSSVIANCKQRKPDNRLVEAKYDFVIGHPELILHEELLAVFKGETWQAKAVYVVVDEYHCVVKWGSGFREKYSELCRLRAIFPHCRMLALTATATVAMQQAICSSLLMRSYAVVKTSVNRANIFLSVMRRDTAETAKMTSSDAFIAALQPLFNELGEKLDAFPRTIVYAKLDWCGLGFEHVDRIMDLGHLAARYHAQCTDQV